MPSVATGTCQDCFLRGTSGVMNVSAKRKALVDAGVHPRIAERIIDVQVKKFGIPRWTLAIEIVDEDGQLRMRPTIESEREAMGILRNRALLVALGVTLMNRRGRKVDDDFREETSAALIDVARRQGVALTIYWRLTAAT